MKNRLTVSVPLFCLGLLLILALAACSSAQSLSPTTEAPKVLAAESFLADLVQQVAGDRLQVGTLLPSGLDPHAFEPTPQDAVRVAQADVLVINGGGLEEFMRPLLQNSGDGQQVIQASQGLVPRQPAAGEQLDAGQAEQGDPHFWLDPSLVVKYIENIRDGLSVYDPEGADLYAQNAAAAIDRLNELDAWVKSQVADIPAGRRLLVTNHESFGYYADRYGFRVVGAVIPAVTSGAAPSARELAALVESIRQVSAPAIFLETGANPQLAEQVARETGIHVVTGLYTHSLSGPSGPAPTYIDMIHYNTTLIVEALR